VWYDSVDLAGLSGDELSAFRGQHVGFIFQFHHLLPEFSALENVALPLIIAGTSERVATERARAMLARVRLEDRCEHRPGQLSGGEQQRVAIARALVGEPAVVLADEPTGNLDVATAGAVQELLLTMNRELGNLLVVVTHSADLARSLDRTVEMQPGGALCFRS
jgi:lipoprotein-releasing system ATP-binding protein